MIENHTLSNRYQCKKENEQVFISIIFSADFGFARFLQDGVMAATLCGSPMYMVRTFSYICIQTNKNYVNIKINEPN